MGDLKLFNLSKISHLYNTRFFVETGTFEGTTTQHAYDVLSSDKKTDGNNQITKFWTIELDELYYQKAVERFKLHPRIEVYHKDSIAGLEYLNTQCCDNAIFWLDAHFIGSDGGHCSYDNDNDLKSRLPLEWELKILQERITKHKDVIIIDDVRIYEDGPYHNGTFDDAMRSMNSSVRRVQISPYNSIEPLLKPFAKTHHVYKLYNDQGYIILLPKSEDVNIESILWK